MIFFRWIVDRPRNIIVDSKVILEITINPTCFILLLSVHSIVQGPSDNQVLQVSDEIRRMGLDAVVRHDSAQFPKLPASLYRVGQLRVDETREHGPVVELRAKVLLLQLEQSSQHPSIDTDHQRKHQRPGQSQPPFTGVSNQIKRIAW